MFSLIFDEYIIRFYVPMNNLLFGNEFESSCELVENLSCFIFWKRAIFQNIIQISFWAKLQYHDNIVLG